MTMTNAEWMIKQGYKFSDIYAYGEYTNDGDFIWHIQLLKGDIDEISSKHDCANVITAWLDSEHKEQILDEAEKRYLSAVIKPFRQKVEYIVKFRDEKEWINIYLGIEYIHFPTFVKGTMYKGMKQGKHYTLEELGL